ncbi:MAG: PDZ domain-containing protein, partial [Planctomycetes bacterium]|nr:PDZ domain-containing protein [Planctomycetota bacterium]
LSVLGRDLTFTLTTASYTVDPSAILVGGKGGSVQARILPKQTRMVEPNRWELGTEDVTAMGAMSEEEVLSAVQVRPKRDQETGAIRGLQVSRLQENSVLARQGIREQDIILDVNGFPATDRGRLLEHMRRQGDSSSVTVTLERAGSVRTYTYRVPRR